jgi:hypothetical protein
MHLMSETLETGEAIPLAHEAIVAFNVARIEEFTLKNREDAAGLYLVDAATMQPVETLPTCDDATRAMLDETYEAVGIDTHAPYETGHIHYPNGTLESTRTFRIAGTTRVVETSVAERDASSRPFNTFKVHVEPVKS